MAGNEHITIVTTRALRILLFKAPENRLLSGMAWKEWLEELERQFRFFGIETPSDMKDALLIYGGRELVCLEKYLPDAEDSLDEYETLKKKLNDHYVPGINKHYENFLFQKMRPKHRESIRSYAMRLREQANECGFYDNGNCDDRILEHLMQTIDNELLIRRCMTKGWSLTQFLSKAVQYEDIQLQIRSMKDTSSKLQKARQNIDGKRQWIQGIYTLPKCSYCGLSGIHPKGYNCPAFSKRCFRCNKLDHFARVCRATEYRNRARNETAH